MRCRTGRGWRYRNWWASRCRRHGSRRIGLQTAHMHARILALKSINFNKVSLRNARIRQKEKGEVAKSEKIWLGSRWIVLILNNNNSLHLEEVVERVYKSARSILILAVVARQSAFFEQRGIVHGSPALERCLEKQCWITAAFEHCMKNNRLGLINASEKKARMQQFA